MAMLRLFASAREAAGTQQVEINGHTVKDVLVQAQQMYGDRFTEVLTSCRVWVNGEEVHDSTVVTDKDEIAVLPPVSGGSL